MLKIALSGASGRMGQSIKALINKNSSFDLVAEFSKESSLENWKASEIDLVVDFSLPAAFQEVFGWAQKNKVPLVSGTTGMDFGSLSQSDLEAPFFYSRNYSLGIAALSAAIKNFSVLDQPKIWIEDYHHANKIDSPSGTALHLKEAAIKCFSDGQKEVEVKSIRAGSVFGVHKVHLATESEWITLEHRALSRELFSEGALQVALWLKDKKAGFYQMKDYIESKLKEEQK